LSRIPWSVVTDTAFHRVLNGSMRGRRIGVLSMHTSPLDQAGTGDSGGLNIYVRELAASMALSGIGCDIYVRRTSREVPEIVELQSGVNVIQIEAGPFGLEKNDLPAVSDIWAEKVAESLGRRPVDALHAHYWLSAVVGHQLKHKFDLPLAVTFHTLGKIKSIAGEHEPAERIRSEDSVIGCADVVFASGNVEADQLTSLYDTPPNRIEILTPGVDRSLFKPGSQKEARALLGMDDRPVLLFVGRIQALKGLDVAIEALPLIQNSSAQLVVVGGLSGDKGAEVYSDLEARVTLYGLQSRVRFVEPQPHHLLPTYYQAADICLVPSRSESFGLVALEAAACGTPVIASDVGGLKDNVLNGSTGLLVNERDHKSFAGAVDKLLLQPELRHSMGQNGSQRAALHSWEMGAKTAIEAYGRLISRELVFCA